MRIKAKLVMVGVVLMLLIGAVFAAEEQAKTEAPASEIPETIPAEEEAGSSEDDKNAQYFTKETLAELAKIDQFKNSKLWACHMLTACKMKAEQVKTSSYILIAIIDDHDIEEQGISSISIYKDIYGLTRKLL